MSACQTSDSILPESIVPKRAIGLFGSRNHSEVVCESQSDPCHGPPPPEAAREAPAPRGGDAHVMHLARAGDTTGITIPIRHVTRLPCGRPRGYLALAEASPPSGPLEYPSVQIRNIRVDPVFDATLGGILGS